MFEPIDGFSIGDVGLFWQAIGEEYAECAAQDRLAPAIEAFAGSPTVRVEVTAAAPIPRALYRHRETGELIQVQNDRFGFNWMLSGDESYPHHEATLAKFCASYETFSATSGGRFEVLLEIDGELQESDGAVEASEAKRYLAQLIFPTS